RTNSTHLIKNVNRDRSSRHSEPRSSNTTHSTMRCTSSLPLNPFSCPPTQQPTSGARPFHSEAPTLQLISSTSIPTGGLIVNRPWLRAPPAGVRYRIWALCRTQPHSTQSFNTPLLAPASKRQALHHPMGSNSAGV